jgi:hypothetical protein
MSSPTSRSLEEMRGRGYELVDVVERWIPGANIRKDLFGIGDLLCVGPGVTVVQTTSASNVAARIAKIANSDAVAPLRRAGIRILVHGWRKVNGRWNLREVDVS